MYACLGVTCHLHFWQNDQGLLHATAVTWGGGGGWTPNQSQHTKLTLEKKILPQLLPRFKLATFQLRIRRSNQQAVPAPEKHLHQCGRREGCGRGFGSYPILWCTSVRLLLPTTSGVTVTLPLPLSTAAFCFFCSSSRAFFAASNSSRSSIFSSILVGVLLNILDLEQQPCWGSFNEASWNWCHEVMPKHTVTAWGRKRTVTA